ncbi:MAG TPA: carboxymuconolactone decarboxylase family protein [Candidatus Eisenbacteria bacterium]|jgi:alkylhydroperoxidase/carboxymuconolactone decarboxylase family protein YurZ
MSKLPSFYSAFREAHPRVATAYQELGEAVRAAGPLTERAAELVKLALAAGAHLEGAVHSHARRALEAGVAPEELRQVPLLAITTLGFPAAMAVRAMIEDVLGPPA